MAYQQKHLVLLGGVSSALTFLVLIIMILTNPAKIGPVGVTAWFILLFAALSMLTATALYIFKQRLLSHDSDRRKILVSLRQGSLIGAGITIFVALSSLRQLSAKDIILVIILLALTEGYLRTRS